MTDLPARFDILGTQLSEMSAVDLYRSLIGPERRAGSSVVFANVHTVMTSQADEQLRHAVLGADYVVPDGVPLVWAMQLLYSKQVERLRGPTVMRETLIRGVEPGVRHFFYGSDEATLSALVDEVERFAPGVAVVGTFSPPFGEFSDERVADDVARILAAQPDLVWVGLGMPKQERWLGAVRQMNLEGGASWLGVGAAFDLLAGQFREAPMWMQRVGLEWVYRLALEPKRLWRRYIINNPRYVIQLGLARLKRQR